MTSKELHETKIIPARMALNKLEAEWQSLFRQEHGNLIGAKATCGNCAYSCVESIGDHNECMGGRCTCCNDWCVHWHPENELSAFLRKHYHYSDHKFWNLQRFFGSDFIEKCDQPKYAEIVMQMMKLMAEFEDKHQEDE